MSSNDDFRLWMASLRSSILALRSMETEKTQAGLPPRTQHQSLMESDMSLVVNWRQRLTKVCMYLVLESYDSGSITQLVLYNQQSACKSHYKHSLSLRGSCVDARNPPTLLEETLSCIFVGRQWHVHVLLRRLCEFSSHVHFCWEADCSKTHYFVAGIRISLEGVCLVLEYWGQCLWHMTAYPGQKHHDHDGHLMALHVLSFMITAWSW